MAVKKKVTLTQAELRKRDEKNVGDACDRFTLLFLAALRDEHGFGEERLIRTLKRFERYAEHVDEHRIAIAEVKEILEKATGMTFVGF